MSARDQVADPTESTTFSTVSGEETHVARLNHRQVSNLKSPPTNTDCVSSPASQCKPLTYRTPPPNSWYHQQLSRLSMSSSRQHATSATPQRQFLTQWNLDQQQQYTNAVKAAMFDSMMYSTSYYAPYGGVYNNSVPFMTPPTYTSTPDNRMHQSPSALKLHIPCGQTTNIASGLMDDETDYGYFSYSSDMSPSQNSQDSSSDGGNANVLSDLLDDLFDNIEAKDASSHRLEVKQDIITSGCMYDSSNIGSLTSGKSTAATPSGDHELDATDETSTTTLSEPVFKTLVLSSCMYSVTPVVKTDPAMPSSSSSSLLPSSSATSATVTKIESKRNVPELQCFECNRTFTSRVNFKVHLRMHRGERPHKCTYCEKSFGQKSTLRTHIRTHTGEKPHKCPDCPRAFSDYSTYRKHVRIHTGDKPYQCDVCQKNFTQSGNMIRHRQTHFKSKTRTKTQPQPTAIGVDSHSRFSNVMF